MFDDNSISFIIKAQDKKTRNKSIKRFMRPRLADIPPVNWAGVNVLLGSLTLEIMAEQSPWYGIKHLPRGK